MKRKNELPTKWYLAYGSSLIMICGTLPLVAFTKFFGVPPLCHDITAIQSIVIAVPGCFGIFIVTYILTFQKEIHWKYAMFISGLFIVVTAALLSRINSCFIILLIPAIIATGSVIYAIKNIITTCENKRQS